MLKQLCLLLMVLALCFSVDAKKKKARLKSKKGKPSTKLGRKAPPRKNADLYLSTWLYATKAEAVTKTKSLRGKKLKASIRRDKLVLNPTALVLKSFTTRKKAKKFGKRYKKIKTEVERFKSQYWLSFGQFYEQKTLEEKKKALAKRGITGTKSILLSRRRVNGFRVVLQEWAKTDGWIAKTGKTFKKAKPQGYYLLEAAYGTEDPGHWSKFKNWFYGSLEGSRKSFDWKISGRFFYDLAFTFEDKFYSDFVKENHESQFIFDETYMHINKWNTDFILGRQHIRWGNLIGAYVADVVTARDMRDFILTHKSIRDIPQWAFLVEKHWSKIAVQVFWMPYVNVDEIGVFGSDFFPLIVSDYGTATINELGREAPDFDPENMGYGGRFSYKSKTWLASLFYLSSINREARYEREFAGANVNLKAKHFAIDKAGFTFNKDLKKYQLRFESAIAMDDKTRIDDPTNTDVDGLVDKNVVDVAFAIDANLLDGSQTTLQYVARTYLDYEPNMLVDENEQFVTAYGNYSFEDNEWLAELTVHVGVQRQDILLRPRFNWAYSTDVDVAFGYDAFSGDSDGLFGRFDNNDRVYTELKINF